jgi:signal transduction histidine kinase
LKKPAIIFAVLSVYIVAAFAWWTYAHIKSSKDIYIEQSKYLELLPYKASLDVRAAVDQELFKDTLGFKEYFNFNYAELNLEFDHTQDPLYNYAITPKKSAVEAIEKLYKRRVWMYGLEGVVMVLLLFWGIIWIYRSLQNRLNLKRQQSNFLLSITHELKTPIASIKLYLETLIKRPNLDKLQSETMMRNSLSDVTRLRDLVENLLLAAQLDTHKFKLSFTEVNLSNLIQDVADKYVLPRNLQQRLKVQLQSDVFANIDAIAIEMVLTNLLSNAFKYSPNDKPVTVTLQKETNGIKIKVIDEGKGIPAGEKKHLFGMFYRAEDENVRKSKGTGLGLFIVKNLLNHHNATIIANDNSPSGVIFEITLQKHDTTQNFIS